MLLCHACMAYETCVFTKGYLSPKAVMLHIIFAISTSIVGVVNSKKFSPGGRFSTDFRPKVTDEPKICLALKVSVTTPQGFFDLTCIIKLISQPPTSKPLCSSRLRPKKILGWSVTFGLKSVEKRPPRANFFELTTPINQRQIRVWDRVLFNHV